jgi:hypothetical protein
MSKLSIRQMDIIAANNTDVGGISLGENIMRPPAVNNAFREYSAELAQWLAEMSYPTVGGTADALTLTPTTALAALANNVVYTGTIGAAANATTTPTLAVSGLAATVIRKMSGGVDVALAIGDLPALTPFVFIYKAAANAAAGAWIVLSYGAVTSFTDSAFRVTSAGDATKKIAFLASGIATGTVRTITVPDSDVSLFPETTAAQYQANTTGKALTTDKVWSAMAVVTLTDAATIAWDMSTGIDFQVTLAGNRTLGNPTNTQVGKKGRIKVIQDATGSRTLAKSSNFKTVGGAALTLSTAANAIDYIDYDCVSATEIRLSLSKAWS